MQKRIADELEKILETECDAVLAEYATALVATEKKSMADVRMQHRALLENQIKDKAFKRAAAEFNKAQERMTAERAEAAYQMMLGDQMAKTSSTMNRFAK